MNVNHHRAWCLANDWNGSRPCNCGAEDSVSEAKHLGYEEIKTEIENAPLSFLPGLLICVVKTSLAKKMLKPGGLARIAKEVEDEYNETTVQTCSHCLAVHDPEKSCQCHLCATPMHPLFIRCAVLGGKRVALCPNCDDARHEKPTY